MSTTFILQNQDLLFYGKNKEWVDGYDANAVFKTPHKDEAVNQMFEITSKDYKQRVKVLSCALNEKGLPDIDSAIMPAPLPKVPKGQSALAELEAAAVGDTLVESDEDVTPDAILEPESDLEPEAAE